MHEGKGYKGCISIIVLLLQQTPALSVVVGGVLGVGAGMAIAAVFAVLLWKKTRIKRGRHTDTCKYMDPVMHQATAQILYAYL